MKKHKIKILSSIGIIAVAISVPLVVTSCTPTITINNQGKPEFGEFIEWSPSLTRWDVRLWRRYNSRYTPSQIRADNALQNLLLSACVENLLVNASLLNKYNIKPSVIEVTETNDQLGYLSIKIRLDGWVSQGIRVDKITDQVFRLFGFNSIS